MAGASGLIGVAAIESFLAAGWDVVGISRRKPELPSGRDFQSNLVDLRDDVTTSFRERERMLTRSMKRRRRLKKPNECSENILIIGYWDAHREAPECRLCRSVVRFAETRPKSQSRTRTPRKTAHYVHVSLMCLEHVSATT